MTPCMSFTINQENGEIKADLTSCSALRSVDDMHYEMLNIINEI